MGKRTINGKEILADIRRGKTNAGMMEKYGLSEKSLQSLLRRLLARGVLQNSELDKETSLLQPKAEDPAHREVFQREGSGLRKIKAKKIAEDIRARVSDFELMSKYGLSSEQLEKLLRRLVEAGTLRQDDINERGLFFDDPANRSKTRRYPRIYLRVPLEIEDLDTASNKGLLTDLSDEGFRTRGITAVVGEEKSFLVSLKEVRKRAVRLRATCIWTKQDGDAKLLKEAGFKILHISESDLLEIRRVVNLLGFRDRNPSRKR